MLTFLEKNSKDRGRARLGAIASGAKTSALAAAEAVLDSVPASGTMSQHEVNEVSLKQSLSLTMSWSTICARKLTKLIVSRPHQNPVVNVCKYEVNFVVLMKLFLF